ncbi:MULTISPECIES: LuxR C-terminal-related transcriptional regulator [Pigmentiphaga]|uniref:HTH luxR-type domain-containing protein n=1 Tax=Pigmentiphaga daeguensis TaxID=414049 RepID=A0ABN1B687_9BURK|nr:LuxR C-terminal-related transcriptional regulator [Pigmentiphaga sp. D-2]
MQLVHLHEPRAEDGSWRHARELASFAMAGVIGCLGHEDFDTAALRQLNAAIALCWWSTYSLHKHRPPELHATGSFQAPDHTRDAFRFYRQGVYRYDQTFEAARERVLHGGAVVTHWHAAELPSEHRDGIYTRHALRERVSLVTAWEEDDLIAINLYRRDEQPAFSDAELDLICGLAPPLIACIESHLRSRRAAARPPACQPAPLAALPRREREVCERLLRGWTHEGIGADLGISAGTVKTYRDRAFERLGIHHRNELFALALDGLAPPSQA